MDDTWQTLEYSFSTAHLFGCVKHHQPAHNVIVSPTCSLLSNVLKLLPHLLRSCSCVHSQTLLKTRMSLQVALEIGARVDMALTGPIMRQETETGWKHILFPQVSILRLHPVYLLPPPPPAPSLSAPSFSTPPHSSAIVAVSFSILQHYATCKKHVSIAFDSDVLLQPWRQLS